MEDKIKWVEREPKHVIIGYKGEVGSAIYEILKKAEHGVWGIDLKAAEGNYSPLARADFLHICIPYSDIFIIKVAEFIEQYCSVDTEVIIHSTVAPRTTESLERIHKKIGFSPVRGVHPNLVKGIKTFPKYYASSNMQSCETVQEMYASVGICCVYTSDTLALEFGKLINTTYYGMIIAMTQEVVRLSKLYGFDKDVVYHFIKTTGDRTLMPYAQTIGGHCIVSNAKILENFHSIMARYMSIHNSMFKSWFADDKIYFESEKNKPKKDPYFPKVDIKGKLKKEEQK